MNNETKKEETNLHATQRINPDILLQNIPVEELLGSVTTYSEGNDKNQALRSSARVFKKIKLDANLLSAANTPEKSVPDKKEEQKSDQTPHKEQRKFNISWISEEVNNLFFDAVNEYGKDFENIYAFILQKLKKKGVTDEFRKDHVRHLYYRTWHKISKYLKFSDGVKRTVQELYGLINYGELRKKVPTTQKIYFKLNELVHLGCVTVRVKGKMLRVRTPMCPALRRLNKLDDKDDDLKLPPRVIIQLQPRDMQAFLKVQSFALNPRVKTELPLQKKLSTFINCVSRRWKAAELEYLRNNYPREEVLNGENDDEILDIDATLITSQLKFAPPKGAKLNLARTEVCDFITKENICLKAYEERMGIDGSKVNDKKDTKKSTQKVRTDSFSETITKLPVKSELRDGIQLLTDKNDVENVSIPNNSTYILNAVENLACPTTVTEECLPHIESDTAVNEEVMCISTNKEKSSDLLSSPSTSKTPRFKKEDNSFDTVHPMDLSFAPVDKSPIVLIPDEISDDNNRKNKDISVEEQLSKLDEIRNGWTVDDCDNLTIGELYLMFGSASKLVLEYHWVKKVNRNSSSVDGEVPNLECETKLNESSDSRLDNFGYSDTLRKLVDLMRMHQKNVTPKCSCGHICSPKNTSSKKIPTKVVEIEEKVNKAETETESSPSTASIEEQQQQQKQKIPKFEDFVKPQSKTPPVHLIAQLDSIEKLKPKYSIRKGRRLITKQLVVERELPLMPKASSGHQIVCMNIISRGGKNSSHQTSVGNGEQETDTGAIECDTDNNFEQVVCMEEDCRRFSEVIENKSADTNMNANEMDGTYQPNNLDALLDPTRSLSPSVLLKENENQWISSDVADFSLSSFLGHLESPMKSHEDVTEDVVDCQFRSLLTENSFDYTAKFADLANKVVGDTAN
ncbi:protein cramped [Coccinella septempunctata]|uniref:protein cramped n=1 Tax=Coccinella septempunctata TaxID=41139 RepID=UPI001D073D39|nr:protein cramped [Coccinella septempunctata]XP_044749050.1 protein cramped [Coccinella septempunctata]